MAALSTTPKDDPELEQAAGPLIRLFSKTSHTLRLRHFLRVFAVLFGLLCASFALVVLLAAALGPSPLWRPIIGAWIVSLGVVVLYVLLSLRSLSAKSKTQGQASQVLSDPATDEIARHITRAAPDLRSDLLSALHFLREPNDEFLSRHLIAEHCKRTAAAASSLEEETLFATPPQRFLLLFGVLSLSLVAVFYAPLSSSLVRGMRSLLSPPPDPTTVSSEPLLSDIRLLLTYPKYTALPQRTIPGATGDILALPGTQVRIEARALQAVEKAQLVVDMGEGKQSRPAQILLVKERDHNKDDAERRTQGYPLLSASLTVKKPGTYYFVLDRPNSQKIREQEGHRIETEQDRPPTIDLFAPGDELELSATRRLELAYSAEDDYGLGEIDLVFRIGEDKERRKRLRTAPPPPPPSPGSGPHPPSSANHPPARTATQKVVWDLSELDLPQGSRVTYFLEARDLDDVSGPNVGRSRSYTLKVVSPRERHDQLLGKQQALLDAAIDLLGDRLDLTKEVTAQQESLFEHAAAVHKKSAAFLILVGSVSDELTKKGGKESDPPKDLRGVLREMGNRLFKLNQEEEAALSARRRAKVPYGPVNERHIQEIERDVLLLSDLLGRQRLEELLSLGDEMVATKERLRQLLSEYKKTRSEALRQEIEREIRQLEKKLAELAQKAQQLMDRGDVPDDFVNREALGQNDMQSRLDRLRDMIHKGDLDKAMAEMERLSQGLDNLMKGMESDLRGYRKERYTAEDKALSEMEDKLADLAHDEELLHRETETLQKEASYRARQLVKDRAEALSKKLLDQVQKLRKQVSDVEVSALGPWGSDEQEKVKKRVDDLAKMLEQGDLDEARAMAQEADGSIARLIDELRGEELASRINQRAQLAKSRGRLEQARPIAKEIIDELTRALPKADELLPPEQRKQLSDQRARQEGIRRRSDQLVKEMQRRAKEIKDAALLERMSQELSEGMKKATSHMERAEGEMKKMSPRGAAAFESQAAEQLSQMRKDAQKARRPKDEEAGSRLEREPVKIPGAEDYRAPKEFRGDILDAAKRDAPTEYKDQVKRYYEELIK